MDDLRDKYVAAIAGAGDEAVLEDIRVAALGKKGEISLRMRELLERMIADSSGKDIDQVSRDIERDKILTAEQAVEYGLIDAVIQPRKGSPALA